MLTKLLIILVAIVFYLMLPAILMLFCLIDTIESKEAD